MKARQTAAAPQITSPGKSASAPAAAAAAKAIASPAKSASAPAAAAEAPAIASPGKSASAPAASILLAFLTAACGTTDGGPPEAIVRDSAGVTIVENVYPDSAAAVWWSLGATPVVDIGGVEVAEEYSLYQVGDVLPLSDGRIVVAGGGSADVRYYAADGTHLKTSGRRGEGPGEFQRPDRLFALGGDSVLVVEAFGSRATVLDAEGTYVRDFTLGGTGPGVSVAGHLSDGRLIGTRNEFSGGEVANGFQRPDIAFVTLTPEGEVQDTVVTVPGAERTINMRSSGGEIQSIEISIQPFSKSTAYSAGGDVLLVATQESPEVRVFGGDGTLRRLVRTGTPMPAVTDAHLDAWFERSRASMPEELRAQAATRPEWPDAGKVVPPYGSVALDDAGNIWIADYDDRISTPNTWSVHDGDGRIIARIRMPAAFRPMHMGEDFVLGVERDEYDVEHVRMYSLTRAP